MGPRRLREMYTRCKNCGGEYCAEFDLLDQLLEATRPTGGLKCPCEKGRVPKGACVSPSEEKRGFQDAAAAAAAAAAAGCQCKEHAAHERYDEERMKQRMALFRKAKSDEPKRLAWEKVMREAFKEEK